MGCVQGSVVKKQRFKISTIPKFGNKRKKNVENRSYSYRKHFIDSIQIREASLQDEIFQNKEDEKRVFMIMQLLRELKNPKEKVPNDLTKAEYATLINEQHEIYNTECSYSYHEHFIDSIQFREASLQDEIFQNKEDEKRVFMIMQLLRELKNLKEKVPNDLT